MNFKICRMISWGIQNPRKMLAMALCLALHNWFAALWLISVSFVARLPAPPTLRRHFLWLHVAFRCSLEGNLTLSHVTRPPRHQPLWLMVWNAVLCVGVGQHLLDTLLKQFQILNFIFYFFLLMEIFYSNI